MQGFLATSYRLPSRGTSPATLQTLHVTHSNPSHLAVSPKYRQPLDGPPERHFRWDPDGGRWGPIRRWDPQPESRHVRHRRRSQEHRGVPGCARTFRARRAHHCMRRRSRVSVVASVHRERCNHAHNTACRTCHAASLTGRTARGEGRAAPPFRVNRRSVPLMHQPLMHTSGRADTPDPVAGLARPCVHGDCAQGPRVTVSASREHRATRMSRSTT